MYKRIVIVNGCSSKYNINPVFISKPNQIQSCLIFHYYFIYNNIFTNHMETVIIIHNLLNILSHQYLFLADIKLEY